MTSREPGTTKQSQFLHDFKSSREPDTTKQSKYLYDLLITSHHKAESVSVLLKRTRHHKEEVSTCMTQGPRNHKAEVSTCMTSREPETTKQRTVSVRPQGYRKTQSRGQYLYDLYGTRHHKAEVIIFASGNQSPQSSGSRHHSRSLYLCDRKTRHHKAKISILYFIQETCHQKQRSVPTYDL